jgi:SAM-dependent methyltransferase
MRAERVEAAKAFLDGYRRIRRMEGWGGGAEYYRGLPFASDGRHSEVWKIRARSYRRALAAIARRFPEMKRADEWDKLALRILELGAGNGWFSWRMAQAGHHVLATDISLDEEDGLNAVARYARPGPALDRLTRALAEMEDLPLEDAQFDLVVANGSLHYASYLPRAIAEAHRLLRDGGLFVILDSPVFDDVESGRAMVRRRKERHRELGVEEAGATVGFLMEHELAALGASVGFRCDVIHPFEGVQRLLRRAFSRVRGTFAPARFPIVVLEK